MFEPVRVEGLKELNSKLRKLDSSYPKMTRLALNEAMGVVVDYGKREIPKRSGRAAATIKGRSTRTEARVTEGGNRAPYVPWLDFGGRIGPRKSVVRRYIQGGRLLYPALSEKQAAIQAAIEQALQQVISDAGLDS